MTQQTVSRLDGKVAIVTGGVARALTRYVEALGGHLDLIANFEDHTVTVTTSEAAA